MSIGVIVVFVWFAIVAAVLIWQFVKGDLANDPSSPTPPAGGSADLC